MINACYAKPGTRCASEEDMFPGEPKQGVSDALSELAGNVLRGYPRLHCLLERGARPIKLRKLMKLCNVTLTNVQVSFEAGSGGADCVVLGVLAI